MPPDTIQSPNESCPFRIRRSARPVRCGRCIRLRPVPEYAPPESAAPAQNRTLPVFSSWAVVHRECGMDGMEIPFLAFHGQQRFQIADMAVILFHSLLGQGEEVGSDNRHANCLAV